VPEEILWIALSEKFHQPFEYWRSLDVTFLNKLFIALDEQGKQYKK